MQRAVQFHVEDDTRSRRLLWLWWRSVFRPYGGQAPATEQVSPEILTYVLSARPRVDLQNASVWPIIAVMEGRTATPTTGRCRLPANRILGSLLEPVRSRKICLQNDL